MQIIRKGDVLSVINETAKNFDYKTRVPEKISEEEDENDDEADIKKDKEYEKFQNKSGGASRQSRHTVNGRNIDITSQKKHREYVGGSDKIVPFVANKLDIPQNEASKLVYKMRKEYRQGATPEDIFQKYGITNPTEIVYNELIAKETVNKAIPLFFKNRGVSKNPDAWLITDEETGIQELVVPICVFYRVPNIENFTGFTTDKGKEYKPGDIISPEEYNDVLSDREKQFVDPIVDGEIFKGHYKKELLRLARKFRLNPAIVYCRKGLQPVKPQTAPRAKYADTRARFSGKALYQIIIQKKLLRTPEEINELISNMRADVEAGSDPREILYENGVFLPNEKISDSIVSELTGIKSGYSSTGKRADISELLKTKLNKILRLNFGSVARDAKTSSDIQFLTPAARKFNKIFDEKALPPIVLSSKYVNRNNVLNNDNIIIEGISYNYYESLYDFLEKVAGLKQGRESTYYLAYQFNQKNRRWNEAKAAFKIDTDRTPIYHLDTQGYRKENFNVIVRLEWKIEGVRTGNEFQWTFSVRVLLGKKGVDDFQILGGLKEINLSNIENYYNNFLVATETTKTKRKVSSYSETSDDKTILDDESVRAALKRTINQMMQKINNEFNPEDKFLSYADIEQYKDLPAENLQEKREAITKFLINRIIQEIKNPR